MTPTIGDSVATAADADRLPDGATIATPTGMTTARKVPRLFRNGRSGWMINGSGFPVSGSQLSAYGRNWTVQSLPEST